MESLLSWFKLFLVPLVGLLIVSLFLLEDLWQQQQNNKDTDTQNNKNKKHIQHHVQHLIQHNATQQNNNHNSAAINSHKGSNRQQQQQTLFHSNNQAHYQRLPSSSLTLSLSLPNTHSLSRKLKHPNSHSHSQHSLESVSQQRFHSNNNKLSEQRIISIPTFLPSVVDTSSLSHSSPPVHSILQLHILNEHNFINSYALTSTALTLKQVLDFHVLHTNQSLDVLIVRYNGKILNDAANDCLQRTIHQLALTDHSLIETEVNYELLIQHLQNYWLTVESEHLHSEFQRETAEADAEVEQAVQRRVEEEQAELSLKLSETELQSVTQQKAEMIESLKRLNDELLNEGELLKSAECNKQEAEVSVNGSDAERKLYKSNQHMCNQLTTQLVKVNKESATLHSRSVKYRQEMRDMKVCIARNQELQHKHSNKDSEELRLKLAQLEQQNEEFQRLDKIKQNYRELVKKIGLQEEDNENLRQQIDRLMGKTRNSSAQEANAHSNSQCSIGSKQRNKPDSTDSSRINSRHNKSTSLPQHSIRFISSTYNKSNVNTNDSSFTPSLTLLSSSPTASSQIDRDVDHWRRVVKSMEREVRELKQWKRRALQQEGQLEGENNTDELFNTSTLKQSPLNTDDTAESQLDSSLSAHHRIHLDPSQFNDPSLPALPPVDFTLQQQQHDFSSQHSNSSSPHTTLSAILSNDFASRSTLQPTAPSFVPRSHRTTASSPFTDQFSTSPQAASPSPVHQHHNSQNSAISAISQQIFSNQPMTSLSSSLLIIDDSQSQTSSVTSQSQLADFAAFEASPITQLTAVKTVGKNESNKRSSNLTHNSSPSFFSTTSSQSSAVQSTTPKFFALS